MEENEIKIEPKIEPFEEEEETTEPVDNSDEYLYVDLDENLPPFLLQFYTCQYRIAVHLSNNNQNNAMYPTCQQFH